MSHSIQPSEADESVNSASAEPVKPGFIRYKPCIGCGARMPHLGANKYVQCLEREVLVLRETLKRLTEPYLCTTACCQRKRVEGSMLCKECSRSPK